MAYKKIMKSSKGKKYNTIHGSASGGGGVDSKCKKANSTHGSASGGGGVDSKALKKNTIHGSSRGSAPGPKTLTGKTNRRMY
jgi:hypothetical protein